jgi:serine/threonine protein kinase
MLSPKQAHALALEFVDDDLEDALQQLPETIGPYRVIRRIGAGGMGVVLEAEQHHPHRHVAIKLLRPHLHTPRTARRLEYEADLLASLRHPNITQVFDAGHHEGMPYYVMEFISGATDVITFANRGALSIEERLRLFITICDAVQHGHQNGIIHRDLKPANILVDEDGVAKVIDFGIARAVDAELPVTSMHSIGDALIGTLQYMSPEQVDPRFRAHGEDGIPTAIDTRSDVYALGLLLYELITGSLPYDVRGTSLTGAARLICTEEPASPAALGIGLRRDMDAIAARALAKDRGQRYQTAADLAADVQRYLVREPIDARRPSPWVRMMRRSSRHPILTVTTICLLIAASTIFSTLFLVWWANRQPYTIEPNPQGDGWDLRARSGRILHTWITNRSTDGGHALWVPRGVDGRRPLVVLAAGLRSEMGGAHSICAFDVERDYERPAWTDSLAPDDIPPELPRPLHVPEAYNPRIFLRADVLTDEPGDEIVAVFQHGPDPQCHARILSVNGEVLRAFWHDGNIFDAHWLREPGLLVFAALNGEAHWPERGHPELLSARHPLVLFAIDPETLRDPMTWISPTSGNEALAWYHCLLPPPVAAQFMGMGNRTLYDRFYEETSSDRRFHYMLTLAEPPEAMMTVEVDRAGHICSESISPPDAYLIRPDAPDLSGLRLGPIPPLTTDVHVGN